MKPDATLEDFQKRDKFLIEYIKKQIIKAEKQIEYFDSEGHGKKSAYKDIYYKLTKDGLDDPKKSAKI